jgi:MoxR-like ATPase
MEDVETTEIIEMPNFLNNENIATISALVAQKDALDQYFKERTDSILIMFIALLIRQHVLFIGPPGIAKSYLIESFCKGVECRFFARQITKFSVPEELFGPYSILALKEGRFERVTTDRLPEAEVAYLDEIFNGNSSILNALNSAMNERVFEGKKIPLECVYGATNFTPEDNANQAFYDRFLFRFLLDYIQDSSAFEEMLISGAFEGAPPVEKAAIDDLRAKLDLVDARAMVGVFSHIRELMRVNSIQVSDRRYKWALQAVKAVALLEGRSFCRKEDADILQHILWSDKKDIPMVATIIMKVTSPIAADIEEFVRQAMSIRTELNALDPSDKDATKAGQAIKGITDGCAKLKLIKKEIKSYIKNLEASGTPLRVKDQSKVEGILGSIEQTRKEQAARIVGSDDEDEDA